MWSWGWGTRWSGRALPEARSFLGEDEGFQGFIKELGKPSLSPDCLSCQRNSA